MSELLFQFGGPTVAGWISSNQNISPISDDSDTTMSSLGKRKEGEKLHKKGGSDAERVHKKSRDDRDKSHQFLKKKDHKHSKSCLLYTSDAADE